MSGRLAACALRAGQCAIFDGFQWATRCGDRMSFQRRLEATAAAVRDAFDAIAPIEMARVAGYGAYGGPTEACARIESAAQACFDAFAAANPSTDLSAIDAAPRLVRGRVVDESVLARRRAVFRQALDWIATAVGRLDPNAAATLEAAWLLAPAEVRKRFASVAAQWAPGAPTARGRVYLAARHAEGLRRALAPTIVEAGLAPVAAERIAGPNPLAIGRGELRRRLAACDGAVVSLVDADGAFASEGGPSADVALSGALFEVAEAERLFPQRCVIIVNRSADLPPEIRRKAAIDLDGPELDAAARARLRSMLAAARWPAGDARV